MTTTETATATTDAPVLAPSVLAALAAPAGWFMAAVWFDADRQQYVDVWDTFGDEEEADEAYRETRAGLSEGFQEGADGFVMTCPTDAAVAATPADDRERLTRFQRGMREVLDGAREA